VVANQFPQPHHETMRVALFGGSFDPPHVSHQLACLYVLLTYPVDEVWMIPVFRHAFDKRSVPYAHRVAMCERAAAAVGPRVKVSTIEQDLGDTSYTLLTVRALQARHPEHEFALVIGADLLKERERWYGFAELAELVPFFILGRSGVHTDSDGEPALHLARDHYPAEGVDLPAVCSTAVRERLAAGVMPTGWVAQSVLAYIKEHGLYGAGPTVPVDKDPPRSP
jgi:nicotinate-nucleotide adenylyltransferase